jgi:hypothetical protein
MKRAGQTRLKKIAENLPKALGPLLKTKKVSTILYQRFRSESIHGATIILDSQRFFTGAEIYWKPLHSDYYGGFELIEFPAKISLSLLEHCMHLVDELGGEFRSHDSHSSLKNGNHVSRK